MATQQAPDFVTLYNFAEAFEVATCQYLASKGIPAFANAETEAMSTSRATVSFTTGQSPEQFAIIDPLSDPPKMEYYKYNGCMLEIEITWQRFNADTPAVAEKMVNEIAAKIRAAMRSSEWPLNNDNLLYYRVHALRPSGENKGVNRDTLCDTLMLRYSIDFSIMPDAWPAAA